MQRGGPDRAGGPAPRMPFAQCHASHSAGFSARAAQFDGNDPAGILATRCGIRRARADHSGHARLLFHRSPVA
eukprot:14734433-Alexandrium_andersonii.AAC.1